MEKSPPSGKGWDEALEFWNSLDNQYVPDFFPPCSCGSNNYVDNTRTIPWEFNNYVINTWTINASICYNTYPLLMAQTVNLPSPSFANIIAPIVTEHTSNTIPGPLCANQSPPSPLNDSGPENLNSPDNFGSLSFAILNTHSAVKHCTEIADMIHTETWFTQYTNHAAGLLCDPLYDILRVDRADSKGGGVALITNKLFKSHTLPCDSIDSCEVLLAKITTDPKTSITIIVIYRPPPLTPNFTDQFSGLVSAHIKPNTKMLIMGDFNLWANDPSDSNATSLLDTLQALGFTMHVEGPTHIFGNTLDWVLSRNIDISNVMISPCAWSDHHLIKFDIQLPRVFSLPVKKSVVSFRNLKHITGVAFSDSVNTLMSENPYASDVNVLGSQLRNAFNQAADRLAPLKSKLVCSDLNSNSHPWFDDSVLLARTSKRSAEKLWRRQPSNDTRSLYKKAAALYKEAIIKAKANHFNSQIEKSASDTRELFNIVKQLEGKTLPSPSVPIDNTWCQNIQDALFKKVDGHITNIHKKLATLPPSTNHIDKIPNTYNITNIPKFHFKPVTELEIIRIVQTMKPTSFKDDIFTAALIQNSIEPLSSWITKLVNRSFEECCVPKCLKNSIITPLLKKPSLDPNSANSYRPVTNVSFLLKILDRVAYMQITAFLDSYNLLHYGQSGFRRAHGTETALLDLKNNISQIIDNGSPVLLLLLDLSAAFDLVSHQLLIERLQKAFAFSDEASSWIASFLHERDTRVMLNSASASATPLVRGVPQGACISPTLYNLYTRPLFDELGSIGVGFTNYADDTQLFIPLSGDYASDVARIQDIYASIQGWMANNQLALNGEKTEMIILGSQQRLSKLSADYSAFTIEGCCIKVVNWVKTLGFCIDSQLNMHKQVSSLKSSCAYVLRLLYQIKPYLSRDNLVRVTAALIHARIDYCNGLFAGADTKVLSSLQTIQNNAVRLVSNLPKREHVTKARRGLHWLPVRQRITHKIASITHNCVKGLAPAYLNKWIRPAPKNRTLRSSADQLLEVPRYKLEKFGGRAFYIQAPKTWNKIPLNLRKIESKDGFKKALKTFLFDAT